MCHKARGGGQEGISNAGRPVPVGGGSLGQQEEMRHPQTANTLLFSRKVCTAGLYSKVPKKFKHGREQGLQQRLLPDPAPESPTRLLKSAPEILLVQIQVAP